MKKKRTAVRIATPIKAAMAIPATALWLRDEESFELLVLGEHVLPEQEVDLESLDVIVIMSCSAFSCHAQADTLKVPRS
jgi:hypothetical protein